MQAATRTNDHAIADALHRAKRIVMFLNIELLAPYALQLLVDYYITKQGGTE
jgi:hypothetical protein